MKFLSADDWWPALAAQLQEIKYDPATISRIVAALREPEQPVVPLDVARFDRRMRQLALDHAEGKISDEDYLTEIGVVRQAKAEAATAANAAPQIDAARVTAYLSHMASTWELMTDEERAELAP